MKRIISKYLYKFKLLVGINKIYYVYIDEGDTLNEAWKKSKKGDTIVVRDKRINNEGNNLFFI